MPSLTIQTEALTRSFGPIRAVDGLSLEVPEGIVFGFLGPNGSGKTTTIHLLLGLLEPDAGHARVLGFDTRAEAGEIRARTGALLEFNGLYERMSAEDNLDFFGRIYRMSAADRGARAKELLTHFNLWDRRKGPVRAWSRGMKQKLAVTRALFHRPQLVFLDEPTAGFDPIAAAELRDGLASVVKQEGATIFLNTHNLVEAERLCAKVGVIRQGRLLAVGSPDDLRRGAGTEAVVVGGGFHGALVESLRRRPEVAGATASDGRLLLRLNGTPSLAPIVRQIVEAGGDVEEVRRGSASLEDAFLTLVKEEAPA
ncbi:MAG: ABC transporter ATP-binding protein [SAR202 cluster bacterium]|nr:ABC transporter ATP-binding protein [SAR202 cluster bacterium]